MSPIPRSSATNSRTLGLRAAASKWRLDAELVLPGSVLPPFSGAALVIATHARSKAARLCPRERRVTDTSCRVTRRCTGPRGVHRGGRCAVLFGIHVCARTSLPVAPRHAWWLAALWYRLGVTRRSRGLVAGPGPADGRQWGNNIEGRQQGDDAHGFGPPWMLLTKNACRSRRNGEDERSKLPGTSCSDICECTDSTKSSRTQSGKVRTMPNKSDDFTCSSFVYTP